MPIYKQNHDSGPSREKILEEKRCNDAKNYLNSIDMIAAYIENRLRNLDDSFH